MKNERMMMHSIAQAIFNKKGINILGLDVRPCKILADYVILAEGLADTHVQAIAEEILEVTAKEGFSLSFEEGRKNGDWIALDFTTIVVHLFMPGMREKYELEALWSDAEVLDLQIDVSPPSGGETVLFESSRAPGKRTAG